jgi:hypothetical protein
MKWFRFHCEALDNAKIQELSADDFRNWVNLLCAACPTGGVLPEMHPLAFKLRVTEQKAARIVQKMIDLHLVDKVADGMYSLHDWNHWQFRSDNSTDRVKRFRQQKSNGPGDSSGNVSGNDYASASVSVSDSGPGKGCVQENRPLYERYDDLLQRWPEHRVGVDLGCQVWISLVDAGEITESNIAEVFAGLERWKSSDLWVKDHGKFIPAIAKPDGGGWLQKRSWRDSPKPAGEESKWA